MASCCGTAESSRTHIVPLAPGNGVEAQTSDQNQFHGHATVEVNDCVLEVFGCSLMGCGIAYLAQLLEQVASVEDDGPM